LSRGTIADLRVLVATLLLLSILFSSSSPAQGITFHPASHPISTGGNLQVFARDLQNNPVSGAWVVAILISLSYPSPYTGVTDSTGQYTFQDLPVGTYSVAAIWNAGNGYCQWALYPYVAVLAGQTITVPLETTTNLRVPSSAGCNPGSIPGMTFPISSVTSSLTSSTAPVGASGGLQVLVLDASRNPVSGALVDIAHVAPSPHYTCTTDSNGQCTLSNLPPGTYSAEATWLANGYCNLATPIASGPLLVTISSGQTPTITVSWTTQFNVPPGGLTLSNGFTVCVSTTPITPSTTTLTVIQISSNPQTVTQTSGLSGSTITVTALDQNGSPMQNVPISFTVSGLGTLSPVSVTAGTTGQATSILTLSSFITSSVTISVQASSGNVQSQSIQVTFLPATTPVASSYSIAFSQSGDCCVGWSVTLNGATESSQPSNIYTIIFNEPNGSYPYTITPPAGFVAQPQSGTVTVNGENVQVNVNFVQPITTPMTGTLQVLVSDQATGNPISGALVQMTNGPTGQSLLSCTTDPSGQCSFQNVVAGSYTVSASANGYQPATGSGSVSTGQTGQATLALTPTTTPPVTAGPSLTVVNYNENPSPPQAGQPFTLNLIVENNGGATVQSPSKLIQSSADPSIDASGGNPSIACAISNPQSISPGQQVALSYHCVATFGFAASPSIYKAVIDSYTSLAVTGFFDFAHFDALGYAKTQLNPTEFAAFSAEYEVIAHTFSSGVDVAQGVAGVVDLAKGNEVTLGVNYDTSLNTPYPVQGESISILVLAPNQKITEFTQWIAAKVAADVVSIGLASAGTVAISGCATIIGCLVPGVLYAGSALVGPVTDALYQRELVDPSADYTQLVTVASPPGFIISVRMNGVAGQALYDEYEYAAYLNASVESSARGYAALNANSSYWASTQYEKAGEFALNATSYFAQMQRDLSQLISQLGSSANQSSFETGLQDLQQGAVAQNITAILQAVGVSGYLNLTSIQSMGYQSLNESTISTLPNVGQFLQYDSQLTLNNIIGQLATTVSGPSISSVSQIVAANSQTIYIYGSGFGNTPPQTVAVGDGSVDTYACNVTAPSLAVWDNSGGSHNWSAGRESCTNFDSIGIMIASWSDSEIVLRGFGSTLSTGIGTWTISPGDSLTINVWGPNNDGRAQFNIVVSGSATTISAPSTTTTASVTSSSATAAFTQTSSTTTIISYSPTTRTDTSPSVSTLTCTYSVSPSSGAAPLTVQFSVSCSGGSQPYSYQWSFGDGSRSTSTLQSLTHTYSTGVYPWSLFVIDSTGNLYSVAGTITIE
jgi:PKD repeat protein